MRIAWRAVAREDWRRITAWLAERNPATAIRIARFLLSAADSLAVLPYRGRIGRVPGTRELFSVPPYVIVYQIEEESGVVRILRIWHIAQKRE